ncbi:MAG: LiaF domain-containing protein [Gemmatimonadaceae bacterium]
MGDFRAEDQRLANSGYSPPESGNELALNPRSISGVVSFLSSNEKKGPWQLSRRFRALAVLGSVELDLRTAEVGYGLSEIEAVALLGNVEITVPPDIAVECDGDSFMGNFVLKYDGRVSPSMANRERIVRITGSAYAGSVTVNVKGPDEAMMKRLSRTLGFSD